MSRICRIYLDNAATTPMHPKVREAMLEAADLFGNPSSLHAEGREASARISLARRQVAGLLHASPSEILFTSGGTESDSLAIRGILAASREKGRHVITSAIEHPAVRNTLFRLSRLGLAEVTELHPDREGTVSPDDLRSAIRPDTVLVTVMTANNEVGTLQPVFQIGNICREAGIPFHTDAVQAAGHLPIDLSSWPVDLLSLSAHKLHGPKGTGALYIRKGTRLLSPATGGKQEGGLRAGTENTMGIIGLGTAAAIFSGHEAEYAERVLSLKNLLCSSLLEAVPGTKVNGSPVSSLPGILSLSFPGVQAEQLLVLMDLNGIAASSGSACTAGSVEPSHVLLAMGRSEQEARNAVRMSLSALNTETEIQKVLEILPELVKRLQC